jgi:hypothetical protein
MYTFELDQLEILDTCKNKNILPLHHRCVFIITLSPFISREIKPSNNTHINSLIESNTTT